MPAQGLSRLKALEQKAEDRDFHVKRTKELESKLIQAQESISNFNRQMDLLKPRDSSKRLQEMERRAMAYDGLMDMMERRNAMVTNLMAQLDMALSDLAGLEEETDGLREKIQQQDAEIKRLKESEQSLQSTVRQLLLGNFEYYEVREGDTLATIAAQPTIYGNAARAAWLRQANANWVEDVDNLQMGEVMIVPRFPPSGKYEF